MGPVAVPPSKCVLSTGKPVRLSLAAEEVATFYGKMLHLECTTKEVFRRNFFSDWQKVCFSVAPAAALSVVSVCPAWLDPRWQSVPWGLQLESPGLRVEGWSSLGAVFCPMSISTQYGGESIV